MATDDVSRTATFRANVRKIGARGLPFDMCFLARQLADRAASSRAPARTRSSSSTTAATPTSPPADAVEPWRAGLAALAAMPNVVAKLSGVFANVAPGTATPRDGPALCRGR